jgi:hypothetical protein
VYLIFSKMACILFVATGTTSGCPNADRLRTLHWRCQCCRLHLRLHHNSLWYVHICVCDMFIDALCVKMKNLVVNISCVCVIGISDTSRFNCRTWRCVWSGRRIEFLGEQPFQHPESSQRK